MEKRMGASLDAGIVTVYRALDGAIHHARCGRRVTLEGRRAGGLELDFYCLACAETVTLPFCVLPSIPAADAALTLFTNDRRV
jgi:hypothetical protein